MRTQISIALCLIGVSVWAAPVLEYKAMPVLIKNTGPDCGACGEWGWTQMENAIHTYAGQAVFVSNETYSYDYSEWPWMSNVYNDQLEKTIQPSGYPTFSINQTKMGNGSFASTIATEQAKAWDIAMTFEAKQIGTTMQVIRYVQTKTPLTGNYQLNTFILEHNYPHYQSFQPKTPVPLHPYVLRQTFPQINGAGGVYGKALPAEALSGNLWSDTTNITALYSMNGKQNDTRVNWNMKEIKVALVLYKDGKIYNGYTRDSTFKAPVAGSSSSSGINSSANLSSSVGASSSVKLSSSSANTSVKNVGKVQFSSFGNQIKLTKDLSIAKDMTLSIFEISGAKIAQYQMAAEQTELNFALPHAGRYLFLSENSEGMESHFYNWLP